MRLLPLFAIICLLAFPLFAIEMLSPRQLELTHGDKVEIGSIGVGQTIAISVKPEVSIGGKFGQGGVYDQLVIVSAPVGWKYKDSKTTSSPLQAEITAPVDAQEGEYEITMRILDEENREELGYLDFTAKVLVKRDIMDMGVEPKQRVVSSGQPAKFTITISNKGDANDVFEVSSEGMQNWNFRKVIFLPARSSKTISYEIAGTEEERYGISITAVSKSSSLVRANQDVTVIVHTNLISDYKAINDGVLFFPLFEAPIYSFAGLFANLFN